MIDLNKPSSDPVVETNVALLRSRSALGIEKYGTTLADSKAPLRDWLEHALLEVLDCANYLQTAMHKIDAAPAPATPAALVDTAEFQQRVQPWMMACFGAEISADRSERNHRFLEESLELVQACGCSASEAHQLVDYVFGRPVGELTQEVGGVMVTLAALCLANDLDMHANAETELARIWTKVEAIRAKQAAKPKHSPLPAAPAPATPEASVDTAEMQRFSHRPNWMQKDSCGGFVEYAVAIAHTERVVAAALEGQKAQIKHLERRRDLALQANKNLLALLASAPQQHAQAALSDLGDVIVVTTEGPRVSLAYRSTEEADIASRVILAILAASHQPAAAAPADAEYGLQVEMTHNGAHVRIYSESGEVMLDQFHAVSPVAQHGGELPQDERYAGCLATIRNLDRISMKFAADLVHLPTVEGSRKRNIDYVTRQDVLDLVVAWRGAWDKNSAQRLPIDRAALAQSAASVPAQAVADGYKLVPVRATGVQREVARTKIGFAAMYEAAVLAAPVPAASVPDAGTGAAPVLTDEQIEAIRHAASLLNLEGYEKPSEDLFNILDATAPQTTEKP